MSTTATERQTWIPTADSFGARLALVRQRMGWGNVAEAAQACALPVSSWRNWERDGRMPRDYVAVCRTISTVTGVDAAWLIGFDQQEPATSWSTTDLPASAYDLAA